MSRKKNIITTSVIISLLLSGVSIVHAEPQNEVTQEQLSQLTEIKVQEKISNKDVAVKLSESLDLKQQAILIKELNIYNSILLEAIKHHEKKDFDGASDLYTKLLDNTEISKEVSVIISTLYELSENQILIINNLELQDSDETINSPITEGVIETSTNETSKNENDLEESDPLQEKLFEDNPGVAKEIKTENKASLTPKIDPKIITQSLSVSSETNVNYRGYLINTNGTINSTPGGEVIRSVDNLSGREIIVSKEASTTNGTWAQISVLGSSINGWIKKSDIEVERVSKSTDTKYRGYLNRSTDTINTHPWGTPDYQEITKVNNLKGKEVEVLREAKTQRASWLYVRVFGTGITGWVDKAGVTPEKITTEKSIKYRGVLSRSNDTLNTHPWGTVGFKEIRRVTDLRGREVEVLREAKTQRASWLYVRVFGTNITGWVDKAGVTPEKITTEKNVNYRGYLGRENDTINTNPWGTPGFKEIRRVTNFKGKEVQVIKEAVTPRATWLYVDVLGTGIKGWIDKAGINPEVISRQSTVNYRGYLSRTTDTLNTQPWGTPNFTQIRHINDLIGKEVKVTQEATTQRATWLYVEVLGTNVKGWIDKSGVRPESIISQKDVNYRSFLVRKTDTLNSLPWGTPGYRQIRQVNDLVNKEVHVTKEAVTDRATWVYVSVVGEDIGGWVDKKGIIQTSVAYRNTYYNLTFEELLAAQMRAGYPQTDAYGGGWKDAKETDVARYLNPENFVNVSNSNTPKMEYVQITTGTLNVRSMPTTSNSKIIGTVTRNQVYEILDGSNGWYKINSNGAIGWISGSYVALISELQYIPKDKVATVSASALNVRTTPSTSGSIVTTINRGGKYKVIDESNGWYKLDINGVSGWASAEYLQVSLDINRDNLQFLSLSSSSGLSIKELNEMLKGKGILEGTGAAFLEASRKYAVNEIYLVAHALLETGNGSSTLARGVKVNGKTVYNMYGIGAVDSNPLGGGSKRAFDEGWDTPEKAIIGGAAFINSSYVNSPAHKQDTLYKMKWNPANPPTRYQRADGVWVNSAHQYATDIGWAVKQTRTLDLITEYSAKYNLVLKFDIPIYK